MQYAAGREGLGAVGKVGRMITGKDGSDAAIGAPKARWLSERHTTVRIARVAVALLMAMAVGLSGLLMFLQFQAARGAAEIQAHRTAHVVATQFGWMLQTSSQALQRIEGAVRASPDSLPGSHDIHEAVRDLPRGLQHSLYDSDGHLILSSVRNPDLINVSDRDYFRRARDGERLVIGPMVTERLTDEKVFIVARRIAINGAFAGVATIAIPVSTLGDLAATLELEPGSTIALIEKSGMVIARSPPIEPTDLSGTPNFDQLTGKPNGVYTSVSPADGTRRIVGFWGVDGWPVIAVAGLNERTAFAAFWSKTRTELAILLPMLAGIVALVIWLFRLQSIDERRERALLDAQKRTEFLIREIHHRVKNNLQAVMSLIRLEKLPDEVRNALVGRISAMVTVHQEMYGTDTYESIPAASYLNRLVRNVARIYGNNLTVETDIADVDLSGDRAMQLGLLVNEIMSNAYKHAFVGRDSGRIEITLAAVAAGRLRLTIRDDGPGRDSSDRTENMGSKLIAAFVAQMQGQMSSDSENGLRVVVEFPQDAAPDPAPLS